MWEFEPDGSGGEHDERARESLADKRDGLVLADDTPGKALSDRGAG